MKNLYTLSTELTWYLNSKFRWNDTSDEINRAYTEEYLPRVLKTATGKNRYPKYYETALNQVFHSVKMLLRDTHTVFGYWYDGEFYTTHRDTAHKTTNDLREYNLTQDQWNSLESGFYYRDSLKLYFK